jgi:DNA-directed RNA polymerase specialized sigma subunit
MQTLPEYDQWAKDPTPDNMAKVVDALAPTITSEIQRYSGPKPLLRARARALATKAVKTYDPTRGAQLRSWLVTQMQPLSRYSQQLKPVHSSEMAIRQSAELDTQRRRLQLDLDREPTDEELADHAGIAVARIKKLRSKVRPSITESALVDPESEELMLPGVMTGNTLDFASEAVYTGLSPREKQIFDWKTGTHGQPQLANQEIARRLGITPAAISQITANIATSIRKATSDAV